jgi:hypothetical protein
MAKQNKKNIDKSHQTAARKAFFASGKDLSQWRGRPARFIDKRKAASKNACRGKQDY